MALYTLDTTIALTTLDKAKQQINIPSADLTQDDILTRFINESSQRLENMTSRKLKSRTFTEYFDGRRNNRLTLTQWPMISIAELWIDSTSEFTDANKKLDSGKYFIDQHEDGVVLKGCFFPRGTRNIKIIYDAGYSTIPADLEGACLWMVDFLYDVRSDERIGTQSKSKNSESVSFFPDVPAFVQDVIDKYTRTEFPLLAVAVENR